MTRPLYESAGDLKNERQVATLLCSLWGMDAHKLPRTYSLDYAMTSRSNTKKVVAFVEIKCRQVPSWQYDTLLISMAKVLRGKAIARETNIPTMLIVRWNDMVGGIDFKDIDSEISLGGRTDRGDQQDVEPVYLIPIERFRKMD